MARGPQVCRPISKCYPNGPEQASKMGRGPDHDHILLARSELVPRDHASGSRATKKIQTITVAPMECHNQGGNSKSHESIQLTAWKLTSPSVPRLASERKLPGKSLTPGQEVPSRTTRRCLNKWCSFCNARGLSILKVCVTTLVEYWTTSKWLMTIPTQLCACMPVPSIAYFNLLHA